MANVEMLQSSQGIEDVTNVNHEVWADWIEINGTVVAMTKDPEGEQPSDRPLVACIPGLMSKPEDFWALAMQMNERGYKLAAIDATKSNKLGKRFFKPDISEFAAAVSEAAEYISPDQKVNIVAHSFGGLVAQYMAIKHPDTVGGQVLCAPGVDLMKGHWPDMPSPRILAALLRAGEETKRTSRSSDLFGEDAQGDPDFAKKLGVLQSPDSESCRNQRAAAMTIMGRIGLGLSHIEAPSLVIASGADIITPPSGSRALSRRLPHSQYVEIDADTEFMSGHGFPFSRSRATANIIDRYFEELRLAGAQHDLVA